MAEYEATITGDALLANDEALDLIRNMAGITGIVVVFEADDDYELAVLVHDLQDELAAAGSEVNIPRPRKVAD